MNRTDDKKETVAFRAVSRDEEGRKKVEKEEVKTLNIDTVKYIERKLMDKGVLRMDRHPVDGLGGIGKPPPKSGHGGKYTWEGPDDLAESELSAVPPAIDEKDPNYVDEEKEEKVLRGEDSDVADLVVGVVEVPKVAEARAGVARVEVDPQLTV
ncbi:uncharacterized protein LOC132161744 [Corylus avellana]|uniref:uncharacterized protein LOC132161744 n=1 Tax=Corylus avellana TaxID=13451 RepID=UPI001E20356D|nr:uncharacterized protein LOC132161744 [Corylus avellana]